uniref:Transmembrane 4 L6 family member 1-like n=1 Tax=Petromyzon marinus TaxID=7757 RepID=A0AAJ7XE30_PETMA|nr:transmembrane 4 L6 family member 1-like [Petromyzon marinus]
MCTGKCTICVGISLIPLAVVAILGNALMFFPYGAINHISKEDPTARITVYALYLGGIGGGGILMLMSVLFSVVGLVGSGYCLAVSTVGLIQGPKCIVNSTSEEWVYPFEQPLHSVNQANVQNGPVNGDDFEERRSYTRRLPEYRHERCPDGPLQLPSPPPPFLSVPRPHNPSSRSSYLFNKTSWSVCVEPLGAVTWHVAFFSIVATTGAVEALLCAVQFINGFLGVLCGTCRKEKAAKNQLPLTRM